MCIDIVNWFNNDFLSLFAEKKEPLKKIEPLIQIIIEEPVEEIVPEQIRSEAEIIYPKETLGLKKKSKINLDLDEPDYTWDIL